MSFQIGNVDLGVGFKGDLGDLQAKMGQAAASVEGFGKKSTGAMKDVAAEADKADDSMQRLAQGIKGAFIGSSVAVGLIGLKNSLMGATGAMIDAQVQLDKLNVGMKFALGNNAGKEIAFMRGEVNRLGLDLSVASHQFMRLSASTSAVGVDAEKTRKIFSAMAQTSTVLGLNTDQFDRAFNAIVQSFSKGQVMAEEIRGQFGEHVPAAFEMAAQAMGISAEQLGKDMQNGLVKPLEFWEKYSTFLLKKTGKDAEEASGMMQASVNRLATAWLVFKQDISQSGVGAALAGGIDLLAKSIGLLAGATASLVAGQLAKWALAGAAALREHLAASAAATAAQAAAIAANQVELASKIQMGAATQAAILVSREEMIAKLANANASLVQAQAQISAARAAGMQSAALHYLRQGELAATAAMQARSVAMAELALLGRQQAAVTASVTAATAAQTAAMAGGAGAASLASRALGLLGGPIGGVITLLGLAATAWAVWGQSAAEGEAKATGAIDKSTAEITTDLEVQIGKLKERNALAAGGLVAMAQAGGDAAQRLGLFQQQINNVQAGRTPDGRGEMADMAARGALLASLTRQYGELYSVTQRLAAEDGKLAAGDALKKQGAALADFTKQYATAQQKANAEVEKWKGLLGDAFTEERRAKIMENFVKPVKEAGGAAKGAADDFAKLRDGLLAKDAGVSPDFANSVDLYADAVTRGRISVAEYVHDLGLLIAQQPIVKQGAKEAADAQEAASKAYLSAIDAQEKGLLTIEQQIAKERENIATLGLSTAAVTELEIAKILENAASKDRLATVMDEIDWSGQLGESYRLEAERLRELAELKGQRSAKETVVEGTKAAKSEWTKFTDQVNQSLTDSLMRAFESGGNFFKTFWKSVVNTFKTTVLKAVIQPVVGALTGMIGLGPGSAMAGQGGGGGSLFSSASSLKSMYDSLNGSVSSGIMNGFTKLVSNGVGEKLGLSYYDGSAYQNTGLGQNMGQAAGMAGNALAGYGIQKTISGEYKIGNGKVMDAITLAASAYFGPIAGVVAGIANRAFGMGAKRVQAQGIEGTFTTTGANVRGFEDWTQKGGWFRSDKGGTNYSSLDKGTSDFFSDSLIQVTAATKAYASILGLNADAINGITQSVRINLKGLDAAGREKAITDAIGGFGDKLAEQLLGTFETVTTRTRSFWRRRTTTTQVWRPGEFVREGETASVALQRLATSLVAVNTVFDTLNVTLMKGSLIGADASSKLLDVFGGAEKFGQATSAYYQAFYTAAERSRVATRQLTDGFRSMGMTLPRSRNELRSLIDAQDLYTDSGRATYAALVQLAPVFDQVTTAAAEAAAEVAGKLIASLTGNRGLVPAMTIAASAIAQAQASATAFTGPVSTINRLLGDAASGTLTFGERLSATTDALDPAQAAVSLLNNEIFTLRTAASGTVVDIAALQTALDGVDTQTFVATVTGVFELIGQRIKDTLSSIADERVAVREAALSMVGGGAMSVAQIRSQIAGSMVNMPTSGIGAAQQALAQADARVVAARSLQAGADRDASVVASRAGAVAAIDAAFEPVKAAFKSFTDYRDWAWSGAGRKSESLALIPVNQQKTAQFNQDSAAYTAQRAAAVAALNAANAAYAASVSVAQTQLSAATAAQTAAAKAAVQSQLDYVASLQKYSLDASKAVTQLGRLRAETVNYYNTQKALADGMNSAATSLRGTIAAFRFDQLDPRAQMDSLQERFNVAYSMALSTTGEALAGYGNELNSLINPLLQKAQEAGLGGTEYSALVNTVLARADATALRLEAFMPQDYQAESLGLLGQIDSTLAALEAGALTADQLIVNAINAGKDTTRDGFRALLAAMTGQTIPAFATGGMHAGGLRIVGENGPELEATGPSRIFNAAQTRSMLSGGGNTQRLEAQVQALTEQVKELTRVAMVTAGHAANTAENTRSMDKNGVLIYTATGQPVEVTPA